MRIDAQQQPVMRLITEKQNMGKQTLDDRSVRYNYPKDEIRRQLFLYQDLRSVHMFTRHCLSREDDKVKLLCMRAKTRL